MRSRAFGAGSVWLLLLGCGGGGASSEPVESASGGASGLPTMAGSAGSSGALGSDAAGSAGANAEPGAASDALDAASDGMSATACLDFSEPSVVGTIEPAELDQLSGLVASRVHEGVLFAHEDSTGAPLVYALDVNGRALATLTLAGAPHTDWEDVALGPGPDGASHLFIGDIGDNAVRTNGAARAEIQVIRLPEPEVTLGQVFTEQTLSTFDVLRFTYPSGAHESESLMVHPISGEILILTRSASGDSRVYRAPGSTPPDVPTPLEEIARVAFDPSGQGAIATAGDISPNGDRILVRTYTNVYVWAAPPGVALGAVFATVPRVLPWAVEPQGEAITFSAGGGSWLSSGEQASAIYRADEACP